MITEGKWGEADRIKQQVRDALGDFDISHTTLEIECSNHVCDGPTTIGHQAH